MHDVFSWEPFDEFESQDVSPCLPGIVFFYGHDEAEITITSIKSSAIVNFPDARPIADQSIVKAILAWTREARLFTHTIRHSSISGWANRAANNSASSRQRRSAMKTV